MSECLPPLLDSRETVVSRESISNLTKDGFVSVEYPIALRGCVTEAMNSWKEFCNLPKKEKLKLSNNDRLNDFGYMLRNDKGPRADKKELFEVSKNQLTELRRRAERIADKRALMFINKIDELITAATELIQPFARTVEEEYKLKGFEKEVMDTKDNWTFRYIHYFGNDTLAHAHADRGGFTLHLDETCEGGECYGLNKKWKPWPVSKESTIIFPGMGLQYRSKNILKALWHRVLKDTTDQKQRFAMVAFIDFKQEYRYNDALRRMQDFNSGFNYIISFDEFKKLFVPNKLT